MKSDYLSVQEQSGFKAGDDGFQVTVKGNTDLTGAVIASTDQAVTDGKNSLTTGTLTTRDLENKDEYSAQSVNIGFGYSSAGKDDKGANKGQSNTGVGKDQQGNATTGADQTPGSTLPSLDGFSATPPIALSASGESHSTTKSGISGGTVTITDSAGQQAKTGQSAEETVASLNRDVASDRDGANALEKIFDEQEIRTRFEIVGAFAREVGTFLENRAQETALAEKALKEEMAKPADQRDYNKIDALVKDLESNETWSMGGTGRLVLTALTGAVSGNVMGSTGSMVQAAAVNVLQGLGAQEVKKIADSLDSEVARTALHGILACGGAAAKGADCGSAAMGAASSVVLNNLIESLDGKNALSLTEEERQARADLVSSLITGIAAGAGLDASGANTAAKIETENNYLTSLELIDLEKKGKDCETSGNPGQCLRDLKEWEYNKTASNAVSLSEALKSCGSNKDCVTSVEDAYGITTSRDVDYVTQYIMDNLGLDEVEARAKAESYIEEADRDIYRAKIDDYYLSPLKYISMLFGGINSVRTLQSGGNKLDDRTAEELNKSSGENLNKREWGRALEDLKKKNHLGNDHHGKIMSNGDYTDKAGKLIDNIFDYLP